LYNNNNNNNNNNKTQNKHTTKRIIIEEKTKGKVEQTSICEVKLVISQEVVTT
jgi:hypothetical protein